MFCCLRYMLGVVVAIVTTSALAIVDQPGTLDPFFATGSPLGAGKFIASVGTGSSKARGIAVQPDGKVLLAGECVGGLNGTDFCTLRYNSNGTLDTDFGVAGAAITSFGPNKDTANAIALQPDGKIVVAGGCWLYAPLDSFCATRYNQDGSLDPNFGSGGKLVTTVEILYEWAVANAIAIQPDGKIVFSGTCTSNGTDSFFCATRYNLNGTIDTAFGSNGKVMSLLGTGSNKALAMTLQADGKIILAGGCHNGLNNVFCAARYTTLGALDTSFATGGMLVDSGGTIGLFRAVAVQPDGKLLFANGCSAIVMSWICVTRYRANGQLDSTFGVGGTAATTPDINAPHVANAVTIQSDGKILVAGYCGNGTNVDFCLLRYHSDGTNDVNFGTSGKVLTAIGVGQDYANVVALQPDGKILLAGHCNNGSTDAFCALRYDGGPFGYRNCSLDIDGDNVPSATVDGLISTRVMLGMNGNAVINGIVFPAAAVRKTWSSIRDYLVTQCGLTLPL